MRWRAFALGLTLSILAAGPAAAGPEGQPRAEKGPEHDRPAPRSPELDRRLESLEVPVRARSGDRARLHVAYLDQYAERRSVGGVLFLDGAGKLRCVALGKGLEDQLRAYRRAWLAAGGEAYRLLYAVVDERGARVELAYPDQLPPVPDGAPAPETARHAVALHWFGGAEIVDPP